MKADSANIIIGFCVVFLISLLVSGCNRQERRFDRFVHKFGMVPDKGAFAVIVIPATGCSGCIRAGLGFMKKRLGRPEYKFIVTAIHDRKLFRIRVGEDVYNHASLIKDIHDIWEQEGLKSIYPQVGIYVDGRLQTLGYIDPYKKHTWKVLDNVELSAIKEF